MNKKALTPLVLIVLAAAFTGCSHQKTSATGTRSSYLLGAVEIEHGAFRSAPVNGVDFNTNNSFGDSGKVSGTQTRIGWGALTFTDY
jgi:hypothetical protein